jgi:hypothetical protein
MILGEHAGDDGPTLDDLFRRAGVRHPHAPALLDPPNRAAFTEGPPRVLTFAQADRAISAFAARLQALGLYSDTVVGLQLPNTVESVIALLGVLRAGMIPAPLPLLWRQRDLVEALDRAGAKVIVTAGWIGSCRQSELAMQVAAELFPIRYVCGFGADPGDGVVPLDDVFSETAEVSAAVRRARAAAHVAVVTFETGADGIIPRARSHAQLVACGTGLAADSGIGPDSTILSTIPLASFATLSAALVPWLIGGGTLHLNHGFDAGAFAAQCAALDGGAVVLPGPALPALAPSLVRAGSVIALWRSPERMGLARQQLAGVLDVACFGEIGCRATQRCADGTVLPLPCHDAVQSKHGTLALRGRSVPLPGFPPGEGEAPEGGVYDTGYPCRIDHERGTLSITAGPAGFAAIGSYRFRRGEVDEVVAEADAQALIATLPDAMLGERFAGSAPDARDVEAALAARGVNPLLAQAFRPRTAAQDAARHIDAALTQSR